MPGPPRASMSLARRYLLASLAVVVAAGIAIAIWVGAQIESSVLDRTANVTALYIDSFVEPHLASLATEATLPDASVAALDDLLGTTELGTRVASFRIWRPDGTIAYSPNPALIGERFQPEGGLARALSGEVSAGMSDLSGSENAYERSRWDRLVETYVPIRERGGGTILAVTEFYQLPDEIDAEVLRARLASWLVVALAALVSYLLLAGIVKRGSDTIDQQQQALSDRVAELQRLLAQNQALHGRLRRAADRTTALNEAGLRRIGSDLHDGPAQTLALALLRIDGEDSGQVVSDAVSSALGDLRLIVSGLRSPAFEEMTVRQTVERGVREHERRIGRPIGLCIGRDVADAIPVAAKIGVYRVLQEALSNATRHAPGTEIDVELEAVDGAITLRVSDRGRGFDPQDVRANALGLAGMRERAELLGGCFEIGPRIDPPGTRVVFSVPVQEGRPA
ncbi:MAG TPA: ATP-binding protein [Candidatus Limnocylindrales bacterium]|nr:ATP-binding protein [Candidatus Limnocylindrales bacterium]